MGVTKGLRYILDVERMTRLPIVVCAIAAIVLRRILGCNINIYVKDLICENMKCLL